MPGPLISIGSVGVDVIPDASGIYARLAAQILPDATRVGDQAGRDMGRRIQSGVSDGMRDGIRAGGRAATAQATREGGQAGGAFGQAMRRRLEAALRALPDIRIGASTSEADADIQALRVRLESLRNQRIGIDIDAARARAEAADIEEQLRRLGAAHPNVQMRVDTAAARAALAEMRAELDRLDRTAVSPRIQVDGGFAQRLRAAVEAAQAQLPDITVDASTSTAAAQIQALRAQLDSLRTVRVGIDVDAATALARIADIQRRLDQVAAGDATVDVRVDAAAASATLAAVQAQVAALDGDTARIDVDVSGATAGLFRLTTLAASVGPALVPAFAGAAYGVGAFVSVLSAATAGVGLFAAAAAPGLFSVGKAVQATTAAEEALAAAQDKTTRGAESRAIAAQQQALSMAGAQATLASAHRQAAQQVADAQGRVQDAARRVEDAQERVADAALRVVDAQEKVVAAERAVADARAQAALRMDAALDRITDAQRSRTDALADARRAELALVDARRAAQQQLDDMAARAEGGAIAERRAVQAEKKARDELRKVKESEAEADSDAAVDAQLAYDEAVLRLKEVRRENARNAAEKAAADKADVDGSRQVQDAQQGIADAQRRVADASEAVREAQEEARRTQVEGARAVEKAEKGVADARRDVVRAQAQVVDAEKGVLRAREQVADAERAVARARVQGAEQVASAQRSVAAAQLAAAAAAAQSTEAMTAANTALDKQKRLLADLSPEQRGVYDAVQRLKDGFKAWGDSLAPATMPLVTRFLDGVTNSLPGLTPLVLAAAEGFERLFDRAGTALKDPFWDRFKENLVANLPRAIESMGVVFGNVFAGMAGVINAFLPQTDAIADSMEGATASFREWGQNLETNKGFASFRAFLKEDWPGVKEAFSDVGGALWQITKALAEISPSAVLILQGVATAIENTPVWVLQTLVDLLVAYRVAAFAMAATTALYVGAMKLYVLATSLATASTWSLAGAMRVLSSANFILFLLTIIGTFTLLMIQSEGFRNKVTGVFKEVGSWGKWLWDQALGPAFRAIGEASVWLWDKAIKPAFDGISLAARILAAVVLTILVAPLLIAFNLLSEAAMFLWEKAIGPSFKAIAALGKWLWEQGLKPFFDFIWGAFQWVGDKAVWLNDRVIQPVFGAIARATDFLWNGPTGMKFSFGLIRGGIDAFAGGIRWLKGEIDKWLDLILTKVGSFTGLFVSAFGMAKTILGVVWDGIKGVVAKPINWVIDLVYTRGIKKVWDAVAGKVGLGAMPDAPRIDGYATGGIYPGYTPGRDTGVIAVGGGEAIMRPEWTRAVGADYVHSANAAARSGGVAGARQFVEAKGLPYLGGFALGGIVDAIGDAVGDPKGFVKDLVRGTIAKGVEVLFKPLRAAVNLLPDSPDWMQATKRIPHKLMDGVLDKLRGEDAKATGGFAVINALQWAKSQAGKPYQWGGGGNPSWDCSGFMAGIQQTILGKKPGRLWTTFDFNGSQAPAGWRQGLEAPFTVGVINFGLGHMAGTLAGTNVESRGGDGVIVGPNARGSRHPLFDSFYGFEPSLAGGGGPMPTGTLATWIGQALAATGTPPPGALDQWMRGMSVLVGRESGGNPLAINTTDGNARAGNASRGLAQVIPTTFAAYRAKSLPNEIFHPVANLAASINYIKSRYGNITNVQQADPNRPPKGYKFGGIVPTRTYDSGGPLAPGLTLAYNGTGQREQVYTAKVNRALLTLAARGADRGGAVGSPSAAGPERVYLVLDDGTTIAAHVERRLAGAGVS